MNASVSFRFVATTTQSRSRQILREVTHDACTFAKIHREHAEYVSLSISEVTTQRITKTNEPFNLLERKKARDLAPSSISRRFFIPVRVSFQSVSGLFYAAVDRAIVTLTLYD